MIGDDVTMYHQVTLGGRGWWRDAKGARRHPIVGDRVVLGVGATVLGPVHIGDDARVGAHALVLCDIPAGARVDPTPVDRDSRFPDHWEAASVPTYPNVLALIGRTPLVELSRFAADLPVRMLAKLESANPGGSVKDRIALAMIEAAEEEGRLTPGATHRRAHQRQHRHRAGHGRRRARAIG